MACSRSSPDSVDGAVMGPLLVSWSCAASILDGLTVVDISVIDIDPCVDSWFAQAHAPPLVERSLQVSGVVSLSFVQDSECLAVEDPVQLAGNQTIVLELTAGVFAEVV
jgi:hypothetical protein